MTMTARGSAGRYMPAQLTTYELRDRREDLEERLRHLPAGSTRAAELRAELGAVTAEQDERDRAERDSSPGGEREARLRAAFGVRLDGL